MSDSETTVEDTVNLSGVQETLLIPLAARAIAPTRYPEIDFCDQLSAKALVTLNIDVSRFTSDDSTMRRCLLRAKWFDGIARKFLDKHPEGLCVSLGAGLDNRALRIGIDRYPKANWIDVDLPDVMDLRHRVFPEHSQVQDLTCDITSLDWMDVTSWKKGRPVLFLAEGVLMFLLPKLGKKLIATLGRVADQKSSYIELAFNYVSPTMVKFGHRNKSVSQTQAVFRWGIKRPSVFMAIDPKLSLIEHSDVAAKIGGRIILIKILYAVLTFGCRLYGLMHFRRNPQTER